MLACVWEKLDYGDTRHIENLDIEYLNSLHEKQKIFYEAKVGEKRDECTET